MIAKVINGKRVFPKLESHDNLKSNHRYVDVRIAWIARSEAKQKNVTKSIDISVYTDKGRLKVKPENWKDGRIIRGEEPAIVNDLNHQIDSISNRIVGYIMNNGELKKQLIELNVYPADVLDRFKRKRTSTTQITKSEREPTPYLRLLWKEFPRTIVKRNVITKAVNENGIEVIRDEMVEEIIDPLSLEKFPDGFPPIIYNHLKEELIRVEKIQEPIDEGIFNLLLKYYIEKRFYKNTVTDLVEIPKESISAFNSGLKSNSFVDAETGEFDKEQYEDALINSHKNQKAKKEIDLIKSLAIDKRYEQGFTYTDNKYILNPLYINPKNIFELMGICRFGHKFDKNKRKPVPICEYNYAWKNLLDYKINGKPSELAKDFNEDWVIDFLNYMRINGHIMFSNRLSSDLFRLQENPTEYLNQERKQYTSVNSFDRLVKGIKRYIKEMYLLKLIPHDFTGIIKSGRFHEFHSATEYEAKYYIKPTEFVQVHNASTLIQQLTKQKLLNLLGLSDGVRLNSKEKVIYESGLTLSLLDEFDTIKEILERTKDLFVCQTLLGAMRISDFNNEAKTKLRSNPTYFFIKFNQEKTGGRVNNPVLHPVLEICKKYNNELPPRFTEHKYNQYLKLLFRVVGLDREFIDEKPSLDGGYNIVSEPLYKAITNKFARATLVTLLTTYGVPDKQIMKWTGHRNFSVFSNHYQSILIDERHSLSEEVMRKLLGENYKEALEKEFL